jgi:hypothetical protein
MKAKPQLSPPHGPRVLKLQLLMEAARKRQLFAPIHAPEMPAASKRPAAQRFQLRGVPYSALND